MEITRKLSLTAMTTEIKNITRKEINRNMILEYLMEKGYIKNIREITEYGFTHGVDYSFTMYGDRYVTYTPSVFYEVLDNLMYIETKYSNLQNRVNTTNRHSTTPRIIDLNDRYPYLGIKDDFVVIDTETTGFYKEDEIVEIAVVDSHKNCIYHSRFFPTREVDSGASKINHMTKYSLRNEPRLKDEWQNIVRAIGNKKILGHNISYDKRMIVQSFNRYGIPYDIEKRFTGCIDSMNLAKKYIQTKSYKLNNLAHLVGIKREERHEATDDCVMTVEFLDELEKIAEKRYKETQK